MSLRADGVLPIGIEDYKVGIAAHRYGSLPRIEAKELGRCCLDQLDETIHAEASFADASGIDQG